MQALKSTLLATREQLAPVLQESAFLERGVLTPAEFERAGDRLVSSFPSWAWGRAEAGAERAAHDADKQFLVLRRVPCHARVAEHLQSVDGGEAGAEAGEEWALPRAAGSAASGEDGLADFSSREAAPAQTQAAAAVEAPPEADCGDDEYEDLSAFVGKSLTIRADAAAAAPAPAPALRAAAAAPAGLGGVVKTRAYDVSISRVRNPNSIPTPNPPL
jgi:ubiquitin-like-conjugating enzyme ATG3